MMDRREAELGACAFTGHRRIKPSHKADREKLISRAVEYAYGRGVRRFYAGGALGFDTLAARQVILFRMSHPDVSLHLILPCADQCDGWSDADRDSYGFILSRADSSELLTEKYEKGCMKARNARLVELADMLIAYADGARSFSGSMQTVRMAKRKGIEVYNLYPTLDKG